MVKPFEKTFENNLKALELSKRFAFITEYETFALYAYARQVRQNAEYDRIGVKAHTPILVTIGAGVGTSSMAIREGCPTGLQFTVDIRDEAHPEGALENERVAFKGAGLKLPEQILGDSGECHKNFNKSIDLIFIDGNHDTDAVTRDIYGWTPKVINGGIIAFHDCHYPSVKKAIDEWLADQKDYCRKVLELDYSVFFEKRFFSSNDG